MVSIQIGTEEFERRLRVSPVTVIAGFSYSASSRDPFVIESDAWVFVLTRAAVTQPWHVVQETQR